MDAWNARETPPISIRGSQFPPVAQAIIEFQAHTLTSSISRRTAVGVPRKCRSNKCHDTECLWHFPSARHRFWQPDGLFFRLSAEPGRGERRAALGTAGEARPRVRLPPLRDLGKRRGCDDEQYPAGARANKRGFSE